MRLNITLLHSDSVIKVIDIFLDINEHDLYSFVLWES